MSGFSCAIAPAVTQLQTWVGNSLQMDHLRVLEGRCESDNARHFAKVAERVIGQAVSKWARVSKSSGFRSVTEPISRMWVLTCCST